MTGRRGGGQAGEGQVVHATAVGRSMVTTPTSAAHRPTSAALLTEQLLAYLQLLHPHPPAARSSAQCQPAAMASLNEQLLGTPPATFPFITTPQTHTSHTPPSISALLTNQLLVHLQRRLHVHIRHRLPLLNDLHSRVAAGSRRVMCKRGKRQAACSSARLHAAHHGHAAHAAHHCGHLHWHNPLPQRRRTWNASSS